MTKTKTATKVLRLAEYQDPVMVYGIRICPFCDQGDVELINEPRKFNYVKCNNCGAKGPYFDGHPDSALVAWNSRSY